MRVNVFNPTDKIIEEHIRGMAIRVPAKGVATVTEKKAPTLLKLHPELSLTRQAEYPSADLALLPRLKKEQLVEICGLLMRGSRVSLANYLNTKPETDSAPGKVAPDNKLPPAAPADSKTESAL
jgi:hypothetical protein